MLGINLLEEIYNQYSKIGNTEELWPREIKVLKSSIKYGFQ
jgi:hypothetical protein